MKIAILLGLILIAGTSVYCASIKNRVHSKSETLASNEATNESSDNPKYMDKVFVSKSVPISSSPEKKSELSNQDQSSLSNITNESRFKETMKDLESPVIVPSLGSSRFDVDKRVAGNLTQRISNRDAYDIKYPNHESYYGDKRVTVKDPHYEQTEDYLINKFSKAIQQGIEWNPAITRAEDFKNNKEIFVPSPQKFSKEAVTTDVNYGALSEPNKNVFETKSDPYKQIFPSK